MDLSPIDFSNRVSASTISTESSTKVSNGSEVSTASKLRLLEIGADISMESSPKSILSKEIVRFGISGEESTISKLRLSSSSSTNHPIFSVVDIDCSFWRWAFPRWRAITVTSGRRDLTVVRVGQIDDRIIYHLLRRWLGD
jgi:hypothetical protein